MNDPNGLVYYDGEWHLFYQSRLARRRGIVWGHAVSKDLLHWQNLPIAIPSGQRREHLLRQRRHRQGQHQRVRHAGQPRDGRCLHGVRRRAGPGRRRSPTACDHGRTFTFYSGNPVIDIGSSQFRDPKVFWYEPAKRWVMVVMMPDDHQVAIYGSPNLKQWTLLEQDGPDAAVRWPVRGAGPVPAQRRRRRFEDQVGARRLHEPGRSATAAARPLPTSGTSTAPRSSSIRATTTRARRPRRRLPTSRARTTGRGRRRARRSARARPRARSPGSRWSTATRGNVSVNSFYGGGASTGTLTSPAFTISKRYINFLLARHQFRDNGREPPRRWFGRAHGDAERSQHARLGCVGRSGSRRQVGADPGRRQQHDGDRAPSSSMTSASRTRPRSPATTEPRGLTGARTTTPASRSTTFPTVAGCSSAG